MGMSPLQIVDSNGEMSSFCDEDTIFMVKSEEKFKAMLAAISSHLRYIEKWGMVTFRSKELISVFRLETTDEFWFMNERTQEQYPPTKKSIRFLLEKHYPDGFIPGTTISDYPRFYPDGKGGY